jgi:hypothetical protein
MISYIDSWAMQQTILECINKIQFLKAPPLLCYISEMIKKGLGDVQYAGKVKPRPLSNSS